MLITQREMLIYLKHQLHFIFNNQILLRAYAQAFQGNLVACYVLPRKRWRPKAHQLHTKQLILLP